MMIVGIDEVGRGPLAGPVTVCALCCSEKNYNKLKKLKTLPRAGLDSKKLKPKERERYCEVLEQLEKEGRISYSIKHISNKIIDSHGLSCATKKALALSIKKLKISLNCKILLDGSLRAPEEFKNQKTIIKGDEKEKIISWASILAKVSRDELMREQAILYPLYKFETHKGYGTREHKFLIKKHGLSDLHRKSFKLG